jgi:hypothetical protein
LQIDLRQREAGALDVEFHVVSACSSIACTSRSHPAFNASLFHRRDDSSIVAVMIVSSKADNVVDTISTIEGAVMKAAAAQYRA